MVIVAAGRGERFGDRGKVLAEAGGRPLLAWSLDAALRAASTADIIVVAGQHTRAEIERLVHASGAHVPIRICLGGEDRQASVRAGISALSDASLVAVIHDAARPLATSEMFDTIAAVARESGAGIIVAPVTDTIKLVEGERIVRTIPRDDLRAAQTPQAFRRDVLADAMVRVEAEGISFTDEAGLLEWSGSPVRAIDGRTANHKVTVPEDLPIIDALLRAREGRK